LDGRYAAIFECAEQLQQLLPTSLSPRGSVLDGRAVALEERIRHYEIRNSVL
jgi:hypothetical protein